MLYLGSDFYFYMTEKFLEYVAIEKRYTENTLISYRKDLEDFLKFIIETEGHDDLMKIDKKVIRNFMVRLSQEKMAKRSINRKLSTLRSFYLYLLKIGEIKTSPMESIQALKFYAEKQIPFSEDEMNALQETDLYNSEENFLKKTIIETLYQTGMRKAELCNLLHENVDFSKKELRITGKGNKTRIVPILDSLLEFLEKFNALRKPEKEAEKYFFVSNKGKKLDPKFVYLTVNSYFSTITSKQKKSPHILRHSFATHVLGNGAEISKVKTVLGHSSLASTQVYTTANIEQLKKVFNRAHPRAKKNGADGSGPEV